MKYVLRLLVVFSLPVFAWSADIDVLHFWTSASEADAVVELKDALETRGHQWVDFAVAGGGGENARAVLAQRVATGTPPLASQMKGTEIIQWSERDELADLQPLAEQDNWDEWIPAAIARHMTPEGRYRAVPVNIHRLNWMWLNRPVLEAAGVEQAPTTWPDLFDALDRLEAAGYTPLAHGSQPWQDTLLFETVALGVGGPEFYREAFLEQRADRLSGATMQEVLTTFRRLKGYTDDAIWGRDWNLATALVKRGEAGIQFMGDWAKGEFLVAGLVPGSDFDCVPAPGTNGTFTYTVDAFGLFDIGQPSLTGPQTDFARMLLDPEVQLAFNRAKGSIPVRTELPLTNFDPCAQRSRTHFLAAAEHDAQLPSFATHMVLPLNRLPDVYEVISQFWSDPRLTPEVAAQRLSDAFRGEGER